MEKWDILDCNGMPTGKTTMRGQCKLKAGEYHLVVHIWIVSPCGKFLLQRRSEQKKLMPGEWAATGGAAISGEDSYTAAGRELYEELGIESNNQDLIKLARIKRRNSLLDIWFINTDVEIDDLTLQQDEVSEAKWASREKLISMINNGEFHNYGSEYFDTLFEEIDNYRGAFV